MGETVACQFLLQVHIKTAQTVRVFLSRSRNGMMQVSVIENKAEIIHNEIGILDGNCTAWHSIGRDALFV